MYLYWAIRLIPAGHFLWSSVWGLVSSLVPPTLALGSSGLRRSRAIDRFQVTWFCLFCHLQPDFSLHKRKKTPSWYLPIAASLRKRKKDGLQGLKSLAGFLYLFFRKMLLLHHIHIRPGRHLGIWRFAPCAKKRAPTKCKTVSQAHATTTSTSSHCKHSTDPHFSTPQKSFYLKVLWHHTKKKEKKKKPNIKNTPNIHSF